jgi:hypothetical protein
MVFVMIIAFISDKIDKKNRKREKNLNSDTERKVIGKKWVCMDEYQRILTQTLSSSGLG